MSSITSRLTSLRDSLPRGVELIAVSKFHSVAEIHEAYTAGQRRFGENRVQELVEKQPQLPADIEWHLIGTLQRNKVKYIVPFVHTIQSIDSSRLLDEVEARCAAIGRSDLQVLLQVHISGEETKHGFSVEELRQFFAAGLHHNYHHARIAGLMAMASFTDDTAIVDTEMARMQALFTEIQQTYYSSDPSFCQLSIGMSDDYPIALRHGATYIRVGTLIFGARDYSR